MGCRYISKLLSTRQTTFFFVIPLLPRYTHLFIHITLALYWLERHEQKNVLISHSISISLSLFLLLLCPSMLFRTLKWSNDFMLFANGEITQFEFSVFSTSPIAFFCKLSDYTHTHTSGKYTTFFRLRTNRCSWWFDCTYRERKRNRTIDRIHLSNAFSSLFYPHESISIVIFRRAPYGCSGLYWSINLVIHNLCLWNWR